MSKSTNKSLFPFCGCDYPRTKQVYVGFSNKKFRRYLKSDKDLDCAYFNKSFYKKFGGVDWDYRGRRKGSKLKKFKDYRLNLFRDEEGELNTDHLHKPIKYNCVVNVKDISKCTKNNIVKLYPKEKVRFNLKLSTVYEARLELWRLTSMKRMCYNEFKDSTHRFDYTGSVYERWLLFIKESNEYYNELEEELYSYSYTTKTTAHECFKRNQQRLQKYFISKR